MPGADGVRPYRGGRAPRPTWSRPISTDTACPLLRAGANLWSGIGPDAAPAQAPRQVARMQALSLLLGLLALLASPRPGTGIAWQGSFEDCLKRSAAEGTPVFIAINMDGEAANERMVAQVYTDDTIIELADSCLALAASVSPHPAWDGECARFPGIVCDEHRSVEAHVRRRILKADAGAQIVAPQHLFLGPNGDVVVSVAYEITASELAWCFVTAIRMVDPGSKVRLPSGARAPKRLILNGVADATAGDGGAAPLTREEALTLIKAMKTGLMRGGRHKALLRILTVDEPEARDFLEVELRRIPGGRAGGRDDPRANLIRQIGVLSPPSYWAVVAEFATSSDDKLRAEAAVALEQLAAPKSLKQVRTALGKEKDPAIAKNWIRALGTTGSGDKRTRKALLKRAAKDKDELLRVNAVVALGSLAPGADVDTMLRMIFTEGQPVERAAAACAMAFTRDPKWIELLEQGAADAPDTPLSDACKAALQVLRRGSLAPLRGPLRQTAKDVIPRKRYFGN